MKTKKLFGVILSFALCFLAGLTVMPVRVFAVDETANTNATTNVAKVGDTEYVTIDEAIANWSNNTTLTLLADVTLSDVIKISSTEYRILDLSTYTMTAASGKDAIQFVINGRASAGYALDIIADATNPGGITTVGNNTAAIRHGGTIKDRAITRIYGGVFNAYYVFAHFTMKTNNWGIQIPDNASTGTNAPQLYIYGGEFNGQIYTRRALIQIYGGTFNEGINASVDTSAYMLISGGRFKKLSNMAGSNLTPDDATAGNKFTIGSEKSVCDRAVYIDNDGYYVVTDTTNNCEVIFAQSYNANNYFTYSVNGNSAVGGMFYESAAKAIDENNNPTITFLKDGITVDVGKSITVDLSKEGAYAPTINLTNVKAKITVIAKEGETPDLTVNMSIDKEGYEIVCVDVEDENGTVTRMYSIHKFSPDWSTDEYGHWHACEDNDGAKKDYAEHNNGEWNSNEEGHWYECEVCGEKKDYAEHNNGEWNSNEDYHWYECEVCDAINGQAEHNNGDWNSNEEGHWRECEICDAINDEAEHDNGEWILGESAHWHECEVCGKRNDYADHTYGEWSSNEEWHWYECVCGNKKDYAEHSGGTANCVSGAICDECNNEYGELAPENHTGKTVLENKLDTWFFADGYTGDTYCADCHELLEMGVTIPKTEYSSWNWWVWVIFILLLPIMIFFVI